MLKPQISAQIYVFFVEERCLKGKYLPFYVYFAALRGLFDQFCEHRIVVGARNGLVNASLTTCPTVITEKDVVDAHWEPFFLEGEAQPMTTLNEGAGEVSGEGAMGIGNGSVVEIAADDDGARQPLFNNGCKRVGLSRT